MRYFLLALFLIIQIHPAHAADPVPRLHVNGNQITASDQPAYLRGVSLCSLEWHNPLDQMKQARDSWSVRFLRLPVQPQEWKRVGSQNYLRDYLDPAVKICRQSSLQCIIDWHQIGPWDKAAETKDLEEFWRLVAPRYAADRNISYEIFNEPTEPTAYTEENWLAWRARAQPWVDQIREKAPHTLLLIGSPSWSQLPAFAAKNPFAGENLAYTMHLYPNHSQRKWDSLFGDAADTIPIIMTEWGWSSQDKNKGDVIYGSAESYGIPLKEYLNARPQIGWTAWSFDPLCGPAMLGPDKDMADFVKQWLAEDRLLPSSSRTPPSR